MDDTAPQPSDPIETIRSEIDRIDTTILSLVAERQLMADKLAGAKAAQAGLPIRPGRELGMLRRLVAAAPAPIDPELVVELWRALIAASLRRQRIIDVIVGGNPKDFKLFDLARRHFGARTRIEFVEGPTEALKRAADNPQSWVAVTPWPGAPSVGSWWPALTETRYSKLHVIAALPVLREADDQGPKAAVFASSPPEEGGDDVTIVMAFDRNHRLQRALADSGLAGREIARGDPKVMIRIEGFLAPDDPRVGSLTRYGLDSVRVLGSYARI